MYEQHWGLKRLPFRNVPEPEFFYRGSSQAAALLKLRYLVENRLHAGMLLGGTGIGKSCLVSLLATELPESCGPTVHMVFPRLSAPELLAWLATELGAEETDVACGQDSLDRTLRRIERQLVSLTLRESRNLIVIDEAHLIEDPQVLQALYLLTNFADRSDIDLSLLLVGDWPFASRVERMGSFDDRIAVRSVLSPLSSEECERYLTHRLEAAGARKVIFDESAIQAVFELTGGVPRRINRLCDLSLLVGFADGRHHLSARHIETVAGELMVSSAAA